MDWVEVHDQALSFCKRFWNLRVQRRLYAVSDTPKSLQIWPLGTEKRVIG